MITQYNRQRGRIYPLNQRGFNQASRNNSHQIWNLISWEEEVQFMRDPAKKLQQETFDTTLNQTSKIPINDDKADEEAKKSVSFKVTQNEGKNESKVEQKPQRINSFLRSGKQGNQEQQKIEKQPLVQTQFQKLKRKSIEKYLKDQVPYTRTMSNSAFRKFYQRPCPEAYGSKNTLTERGAFYGNFMKTHNVQPHTLDNKPQNYQTYISALNHGKRAKLDLEDRWKRIERQLAKNLDYRELNYMRAVGQIDMQDKTKDQILKLNIDHYGKKEGQKYQVAEPLNRTKSAKSLGRMQTRATFQNTMINDEDLKSISSEKKKSKSSSKPLYYIYKFKEESEGYNCTRYARDRHGITCYVDPAFRQNNEAYLQFQKNIKSIYPQKCKPEDINIDQIRIKNNERNKEEKEEIPQHYLMPVVDVPYVANKYSRKTAVPQNQT